MTGQTDGRKYYTDTQGIWPRDLRPHALCAITGRDLIAKKRRRQPDRERDRDTDI